MRRRHERAQKKLSLELRTEVNRNSEDNKVYEHNGIHSDSIHKNLNI